MLRGPGWGGPGSGAGVDGSHPPSEAAGQMQHTALPLTLQGEDFATLPGGQKNAASQPQALVCQSGGRITGATRGLWRGRQSQLTTTRASDPPPPPNPVCLSCSQPVVRKSSYRVQGHDLGHWFSGWQPWNLKSVSVEGGDG